MHSNETVIEYILSKSDLEEKDLKDLSSYQLSLIRRGVTYKDQLWRYVEPDEHLYVELYFEHKDEDVIHGHVSHYYFIREYAKTCKIPAYLASQECLKANEMSAPFDTVSIYERSIQRLEDIENADERETLRKNVLARIDHDAQQKAKYFCVEDIYITLKNTLKSSMLEELTKKAAVHVITQKEINIDLVRTADVIVKFLGDKYCNSIIARSYVLSILINLQNKEKEDLLGKGGVE